MKKIILFIVFFVYLIHSSWAQDNNTKETTRADELNKARKQFKNEETIVEHLVKVPDDEWPTQVIFDTTNICYAGTLRWIIMGQPGLAGQVPPPYVIRIMTVHCFCVIDKLRTEYKFTAYTDMLKGDDPLMPKFLPELFMKKAIECIKEHNTLAGFVVLDKNMFGEKIDKDDLIVQDYIKKKKDNETKNDTKIEVEPPDNNSGKSDSTPEQPNELPTEDAPLLNF